MFSLWSPIMVSNYYKLSLCSRLFINGYPIDSSWVWDGCWTIIQWFYGESRWSWRWVHWGFQKWCSSNFTSPLLTIDIFSWLKHLYCFICQSYPTKVHLWVFGSFFKKLKMGRHTYVLQPKTRKCHTLDFWPRRCLNGVVKLSLYVQENNLWRNYDIQTISTQK